jgi:hypothetical protein
MAQRTTNQWIINGTQAKKEEASRKEGLCLTLREVTIGQGQAGDPLKVHFACLPSIGDGLHKYPYSLMSVL